MLGATLAGGSPDVLAALAGAGRCAGLAFQLHDDLQGAFGDPASTGKPVGEDLREGRSTYLLAVARERCEAAGDRTGLRVLETVTGAPHTAGDEDVRRARDVLDQGGARAQVAAEVERLCRRGEEALAGAPLDRPATARLVRLLREACGLPPGDAADTAGEPGDESRAAGASGRATGTAGASGRATPTAGESGRATGAVRGSDRATGTTAGESGRASGTTAGESRRAAGEPGRAAGDPRRAAGDPGRTAGPMTEFDDALTGDPR
ncbi:polyprenyl synthetase family protein [Streptomyces sp. NPDC001809]